ncbi:MAG: DNA replication/repair protein RecF, partial [Oscillospiraceae bacterium]
MIAHKIKLENFRNYEKLDLDFGENINIIYGDNAQGKTNILEAVHMFSVGKSNRTYKDGELIMHGKPSAKAAIEFSAQEREQSACIEMFKSKRKIISVNDIPIKKNSELVGRFNVVYFGPEFLGLVKDGPKKRRRNIDVLISQLRPNYFSAIVSLRKIVESKNALLKMLQPNETLLEIMNEKLANVSTEIIRYRCTYIEKIEKIATEIQSEISGGTETLSIKYLSCVGDVSGMNDEEICTKIKEKITASQKREREYHECIIGPHREDIEFDINGKDAKVFGSQGQQKTIVLVEKLAEVTLIHEEIGEYPVLLLDDIMSELDKKRQGFILRRIPNIQILITCTEKDGFETLNNSRYIHVVDGR